MSEKPICVLAGTKMQYEEWLVENGLTRHDTRYCPDMESIRGCEFSKIVTVGTFNSRRDAGRILTEERTRVR